MRCVASQTHSQQHVHCTLYTSNRHIPSSSRKPVYMRLFQCLHFYCCCCRSTWLCSRRRRRGNRRCSRWGWESAGGCHLTTCYWMSCHATCPLAKGCHVMPLAACYWMSSAEVAACCWMSWQLGNLVQRLLVAEANKPDSWKEMHNSLTEAWHVCLLLLKLLTNWCYCNKMNLNDSNFDIFTPMTVRNASSCNL